MRDENFWMAVMNKGNDRVQPKRFGAIRAALLFGTVAIALAAILTPIVADRSSSARIARSTDQYDNITTSSIPKLNRKKTTYVVQQSILQDVPGAECIIYSNGRKTGDC